MAFNFTDKIVNDEPNATLIVDALNLAFRWKHQGRSDFRYEYQRTVESLAKSYDCKRLIIAADWVAVATEKRYTQSINKIEKISSLNNQRKKESPLKSSLKNSKHLWIC